MVTLLGMKMYTYFHQ